MSQHKLDRKEIKQPDAFQTSVQRGLEKIAPYLRYILIAVVAAGFVMAGKWAIDMRSAQVGEKLNLTYGKAVESYERNLQLQLVDGEVAWDETLTQLGTLYAEASGSPLRPLILQYIVNTYIEMKNYDGALGAVADLIAQLEKRPDLLTIAIYSKAKALELKGDRNGAIAAYNDAAALSPNPLGEFLEEEAKRANTPQLPKAMVDRFLTTTAKE